MDDLFHDARNRREGVEGGGGEGICSGKKRSAHRGQSDRSRNIGVDSWREPRWTTRRDPIGAIDRRRSVADIPTCTVAPPRAPEDRHKWSSTRHSEAFHAAGVPAARDTHRHPLLRHQVEFLAGRKNLSSDKWWRQGVVPGTWPWYKRPPRRAAPRHARPKWFPAFFDL